MTDRKEPGSAALSEADELLLDADLALLMRNDPAPEMSADLSARILADAAEVVAVEAPNQALAARQTNEPGFLANFIAFWRPMSAGIAAAALGVWIGWADPSGISQYADGLLATDMSSQGLSDFELSELSPAEPADLLDLEL